VFKAFRSLCPVTNQPDIADIYIIADLNAQNKEDISEYLGSFFEKNGFHERCVEEIFLELIDISLNQSVKKSLTRCTR